MATPLQLTAGRKRLLIVTATLLSIGAVSALVVAQTSTVARQARRLDTLESRTQRLENALASAGTTSAQSAIPTVSPGNGPLPSKGAKSVDTREQLCSIVRVAHARTGKELTVTIRPAQLYAGDTAVAVARAHGVALQSDYYVDEATKTVDLEMLAATPVRLLGSGSKAATVTAQTLLRNPSPAQGRWFYATIHQRRLVLGLREIALH